MNALQVLSGEICTVLHAGCDGCDGELYVYVMVQAR
jgi:hypothetical protein